MEKKIMMFFSAIRKIILRQVSLFILFLLFVILFFVHSVLIHENKPVKNLRYTNQEIGISFNYPDSWGKVSAKHISKSVSLDYPAFEEISFDKTPSPSIGIYRIDSVLSILGNGHSFSWLTMTKQEGNTKLAMLEKTCGSKIITDDLKRLLEHNNFFFLGEAGGAQNINYVQSNDGSTCGIFLEDEAGYSVGGTYQSIKYILLNHSKSLFIFITYDLTEQPLNNDWRTVLKELKSQTPEEQQKAHDDLTNLIARDKDYNQLVSEINSLVESLKI